MNFKVTKHFKMHLNIKILDALNFLLFAIKYVVFIALIKEI